MKPWDDYIHRVNNGDTSDKNPNGMKKRPHCRNDAKEPIIIYANVPCHTALKKLRNSPICVQSNTSRPIITVEDQVIPIWRRLGVS